MEREKEKVMDHNENVVECTVKGGQGRAPAPVHRGGLIFLCQVLWQLIRLCVAEEWVK